MSATAATLELPVAGLDHDRRPGLARLTGVELRKMVDTRAGFWLQLFNLGLMIAFVVVALILADPQDRTFQDLMWVALWPASSLLPVVGVLLISSEWSISCTRSRNESRFPSANWRSSATIGPRTRSFAGKQ